MKRIPISLIVLILSSISIMAQNAVIQGNISHADEFSPLAGVTIYLKDTQLGTSTNGNGNYSIKNIPKGNYTLIVSSIGYFTLEKEVELPENDTLDINFSMIETISDLLEITVTTGGVLGLKNIPGSVNYISPKELQKFSYTDISQILRAVPGVNIQEEDGFGLRPNIGLRGTGVERSSKITVMEDGVLMAPAPYAAPAAYYFPTIGRMQAVEILKGSSQIKYGPYTTGGAINLVSTQIPDAFSGRINLLGGSFGGRNLHAFVGNAHKNVAYMVETFQYSSDGFKELDGGGNTGFDKKDYLVKFRINTNDSAKVYQSLSFKAGRVNETSNETYLGLTQTDFDANPYRRYAGSQVDQMNVEQSQLSVTHRAKFSDHFNIATTAYRTDFSRNWYKLDKVKDSADNSIKIGSILNNPSEYEEAYNILTGTSSSHSDALFVKANNRSYYGQGLQTTLGFDFKTGVIDHNINFGVRIHQDQIDRFQWVDEYGMEDGVMELTKSGLGGTESNRIETANAIATHLQYTLKFGKFTAIPGIRHENIKIDRKDYGKEDPERVGSDLSERSNQVDVFIPGIGLDYQFNRFMSTFAGVHKGFAPPGSNDETEPEESVNYELGVRYTKNALSGEAVLFLNDYNNLLGADLAAGGGAGTNDLYNGGEVRTKGLELQLSYDLLSVNRKSEFSMPLSLAYTYTAAEFLNDFESEFEGWGNVLAGDAFPYLAKNQLTLSLGLIHHKFSINLSGKYLSEMLTSPGQGTIADVDKIDAYFTFDASASYQAHEYISLFASMTNLGDRKYVVAKRPAGLRPGMPRALNVGLKANF